MINGKINPQGWKEMTQDGHANPQKKEPRVAKTVWKEKIEEDCLYPTSKLMWSHSSNERVHVGMKIGMLIKELRTRNLPLYLRSTDFQQKYQDNSKEKKVFSTSAGTTGCCNNAPTKRRTIFEI